MGPGSLVNSPLPDRPGKGKEAREGKAQTRFTERRSIAITAGRGGGAGVGIMGLSGAPRLLGPA